MHPLTKTLIDNGFQTEFSCERCGVQLDPETLVWLELNCHTGEWAEPGSQPWSDTEQSQGCFPFGRACAKHYR